MVILLIPVLQVHQSVNWSGFGHNFMRALAHRVDGRADRQTASNNAKPQLTSNKGAPNKPPTEAGEKLGEGNDRHKICTVLMRARDTSCVVFKRV